MAVTVTKIAAADDVHGKTRVVYADVLFDNSYPTGGESIPPSQVGMRRFFWVEGVAKNAAGTLALPTVFDYANNKVQILRYDGASAGKASLEEAAAAFDASAFTARMKFEGE